MQELSGGVTVYHSFSCIFWLTKIFFHGKSGIFVFVEGYFTNTAHIIFLFSVPLSVKHIWIKFGLHFEMGFFTSLSIQLLQKIGWYANGAFDGALMKVANFQNYQPLSSRLRLSLKITQSSCTVAALELCSGPLSCLCAGRSMIDELRSTEGQGSQ